MPGNLFHAAQTSLRKVHAHDGKLAHMPAIRELGGEVRTLIRAQYLGRLRCEGVSTTKGGISGH